MARALRVARNTKDEGDTNMWTKTKKAATAASCFALLALASTVVFADDKIEGTFDLNKWGFGQTSKASVWIQKVDGEEGKYTVIRKAGPIITRGTANLRSDGWLQVTFKGATRSTGAA